MPEIKQPEHQPDFPKGNIFVSDKMQIKVKSIDRIEKADLEFEDIDITGQSFVAHVFLNNIEAKHDTPKTPEKGYAGSFSVFAHGGRCYGGPRHCEPTPRTNIYDFRSSHPLTPGYALLRITEHVKKIAKENKTLTVTVVSFATGYDEMTDMKNLLKFKKLRLDIYDK